MMLSLAAALILIQEEDPKPLTKDQQEKELAERTSAKLLGISTFDSFCSSAWALSDVAIYSDLEDIGKVKLMNPFLEAYKPTWREVFDTVARQTQTSWAYSEKEAGWVFRKPALELPFTIELAKDWTREDRGLYLFCKPPKAPVGMDVYLFGSYSFEKDADKEILKMRDAWALQLLQQIKPGMKIEDMKKVSIDGAEALHVETPAPKPKVVWRQWVFAKEGRVYAIVSALDESQDELVKDVQAMVASFKVRKGK